jgi:CheY-like chemotaxis protein
MSTATPKPGRRLALVVDDEAAIRLIVSRALEIVGFQVEEAEDGPAALAAMERLTPDVILLDIRLRGMDGFRVCQSIRQLPHGKTVPVLLVTGMDTTELLPRVKAVGATDIIAKPISPLVLAQRVHTLVGERHAASSEAG